jgi:hypothetical protein
MVNFIIVILDRKRTIRLHRHEDAQQHSSFTFIAVVVAAAFIESFGFLQFTMTPLRLAIQNTNVRTLLV